jgi:hypothetical protein
LAGAYLVWSLNGVIRMTQQTSQPKARRVRHGTVWEENAVTVTHHRGRGALSRSGTPVALAQYYLEVWTSERQTGGTIVGSLDARPDLVPEGELAEFVLTLATGATLRCQLQPMTVPGTYEVIALGEIEAARP